MNLIPKQEIGKFDPERYFQELILFLKVSENAMEAFNKSITEADSQVLLCPIFITELVQSSLTEKLMRWRNASIFAYPNQKLVSLESTQNWLREAVLANPNRILFMIYGQSLESLGQIGITWNSGIIEIDNVLRGEDTDPGSMSASMKVLEHWISETFNVEEVSLRVLETNLIAQKFYEKLGYTATAIEPVLVTLSDDSTQARNYIKMVKAITPKKSMDVTLTLTAGPSISNVETALTASATREGWRAHHSDFLIEFEKRFSDYVGSKFAVATTSCSSALHLSLMALGIGPGDEVIVPNVTWVATASAVEYVGATPVFADIELGSWTLSKSSVERLITERTKAIIPVHLYGYSASILEICELAKANGIAVLEDAAPAIGTLFGNRAVGTFGDIGCFSFQGAKMLVTGEGGMLVTDNRELYEAIKKDQDHGRIPGTFWIDQVGHKYKMPNIVAALGIGQLSSVERQISKKRIINDWYQQALKDIDGFHFQEEIQNSRSICWMTSFYTTKIPRENIFALLKNANIDTRPTFPSISDYPMWVNINRTENENAKIVGTYGINLPSGVNLTKNEVYKISDLLKRALD